MSLDEATISQTFELVRRYMVLDAEVPVRPVRTPEDLESDLALEITGVGAPLHEVIAKLWRVMAATPSTTSVKFFNQLFAGQDAAATVADIVSAVANTPMYTFKSGGPQILIEKACIRRMAAKVGYEDGDGIFAPGGSLSNMAAMILAPQRGRRGPRDAGLNGSRAIVYTSEECHYSVRKAAGMVGIGRENVRFVPADPDGRMDPKALRRMILEDRASGARPIMINATAGTTVQGAFDPIDAVADVARELGVWLHVDGAWGGSALLCERLRPLMKGVHRADSVTWDAHKLLGVPLTSSVLLTKRRGLCRQNFDESASYLYQEDDDDLNPGRSSIQCGRRNDALKLWTAWNHHGDAGYDRMISHMRDLAERARDVIAADPALVLSHEPQFVNVCLEVRGKPSDDVCALLGRRQKAKVGWGVVKGRKVIRLVFANPEVTMDGVEELIADIREVATDLPERDNALTPEELCGAC
ncbi:MAG: aminotransferase class V-fold PLP-dependent enzyme [Phycisphaerales bacterium]